MIKDKKLLEEFEKYFMRKEKLSVKEKFKILNEMYKFAKKFGTFNDNSLESIEKNIKIAKIINGV